MSVTLEILSRTNYFPVRDGWVWQECVCRSSDDGSVSVWEIPLRRLGSAQ